MVARGGWNLGGGKWWVDRDVYELLGDCAGIHANYNAL